MAYIGVFDSGVGGLTVLKALREAYPYTEFAYLADCANMPYGGRSRAELQHIFDGIRELFSDADSIISACNTMSLFAQDAGIPNIADALTDTVQSLQPSSVGVVATPFTIQNGLYAELFAQKHITAALHQISADTLAGAVESGSAGAADILEGCIAQFPEDTQCIVLGCTHYNVLIPQINDPRIINPYEGIIKKLNIKKNNDKTIKPIRFLTTQYNTRLQKISDNIMGTDIDWVSI